MTDSGIGLVSTTYGPVLLLTRSPRYFFDLDPIRVPLKHPDAAGGSRASGGVHKDEPAEVDATNRR